MKRPDKRNPPITFFPKVQFVNQREEQSPFICDVMAKSKIFIELQGRVPTEEEFIDDIRTMGT